MLLDEPTNHLDLHHQMTLLPPLIAASQRGGGALVMSLHDVNLAEQFCSHCLLLLEGVRCWRGQWPRCSMPRPSAVSIATR